MLAPYPVDPRFTHGGVEKVTHNLVEGFVGREDAELHVVSLSFVDRPLEQERAPNVTIHHVPRQRRLSLPTFSFLSVARARRTVRGLRPDLVHCQEAGLQAYIASGLPYPTLVTIHAVFSNEGRFYPGLKSRFRYWQVDHLARRAVRGVDLYVPSSAYAAEHLDQAGARVAEVVENPIEPRYFEIPDRTVPGRLLFAGTFYPRKGIVELVRAAARLDAAGVPFSLHLAGAVHSPEYEARARREAREAGLEDKVVFRGFLTEEDLAREFGEAAVVVLPSFAETSPMTVQQAMAAGKAVVATRVGGVPHLIRDGESGRLVEPGDVAGLAAALAEVLRDEEGRRRLAAAARREAEARFSAAGAAERSLALYRRVLAERSTA